MQACAASGYCVRMYDQGIVSRHSRVAHTMAIHSLSLSFALESHRLLSFRLCRQSLTHIIRFSFSSSRPPHHPLPSPVAAQVLHRLHCGQYPYASLQHSSPSSRMPQSHTKALRSTQGCLTWGQSSAHCLCHQFVGICVFDVAFLITFWYVVRVF